MYKKQKFPILSEPIFSIKQLTLMVNLVGELGVELLICMGFTDCPKLTENSVFRFVFCAKKLDHTLARKNDAPMPHRKMHLIIYHVKVFF